MDSIKITIKDDGTIVTDTDRISMPNHSNSEAFLRRIGELLRGAVSIKAKHGKAHTHTHVHEDGSKHTHSH